MTANFYDVVLLGTQLGSLLCGSLLAKRGFRVLVVRQDDLPPLYQAGGLSLPRAPFTFLAASSPVARRIFAELALHQIFRRRAVTMDPVFQVALPQHRIDVPAGEAELDWEIEREFPEVRRAVEDFHRSVARSSDELDRFVMRDLVWPPETFLERREFGRAAAHLPFDRTGERKDPFAEFPEGHPFRLVVQTPLRFSDGMDPDHTTALRLTRLYSSWLRDAATLEGGLDGLRRMLIDSIRTHSGDVRESERIDGVLVKRGVANGVRIAASGETIGCAFVVHGGDLSGLVRLLPDRRPFELLFERIGEPQARYYRYTLNLVLAAEGVPVGMARDLFFVRDVRRTLSGANALRVQLDPPDAQGRSLLCVEVLLPRRGIEDVPGYVEQVRERIFASLGELVPFLGRHVLLVDSPHDGRDIQDIATGRTIAPAEPWNRGPSTMKAIYGYPVTSALGACAMPLRTRIKRLLLCNDQVVPGLGLEGVFLAAWSAARIITRADKKKEWMRRGVWTRVEM